jgi:hypothetical protein
MLGTRGTMQVSNVMSETNMPPILPQNKNGV